MWPEKTSICFLRAELTKWADRGVPFGESYTRLRPHFSQTYPSARFRNQPKKLSEVRATSRQDPFFYESVPKPITETVVSRAARGGEISSQSGNFI